MFKVESATLAVATSVLQQTSVKEQLFVIAVINALVWVGVFLFILWLFNRQTKSVEDRLSRLESSLPEDSSTLRK